MKFQIVSTNSVIIEADSLATAQAIADLLHYPGDTTVTKITERVYPGDIVENLGKKYFLVKVWTEGVWRGHFALVSIHDFTQYSHILLKSKNGEQWVTMDDITEAHISMSNPRLTGKNMKDCINYKD